MDMNFKPGENNENVLEKFGRNLNLEVKNKIAQHASQLALGYKTIFVDSGSNCYYLIQFLDRNIELFTNSITNANLALDLGFQNVNILGGTLKQETN